MRRYLDGTVMLAACLIITYGTLVATGHAPGLTTVVFGQAPMVVDSWPGVYRVAGTNPDGSTYDGAVEIRRVGDSELYHLSWGLDGDPDVVAMTAFGFVEGGRLVAAGLEGPMVMTYDAAGAGRWALPRDEFRAPEREQLTRTDAKTLRDAVRAVRGIQASRGRTINTKG